MKEIFVNRTDDYYGQTRDVNEGMDNELTVSHILRSANQFTKNGLAYGAIISRNLQIPEGARILEVGPGLGDLAENICRELKDFHYTFYDISYDYIRHLKARFRGRRFSFETGDFLQAKLKDKFDVIICNEVLADFPTLVNMTLYNPKIRQGDENAYYDAVSLIKFYGLPLVKISNFNYGAVKFLDTAKQLLERGGKIFLCEHASEKPARIGVFGHSEYTIDFAALAKVASKLGFAVRRGIMTEMLGINQRRAIIFYTQPELKMLYNFFKKRGILLEQRAYEVSEVLDMLESHGVRLRDREEYAKILEAQAKPLRTITDQFSYLMLASKKEPWSSDS
jgi:SAM-dependent methyltransferase